MIALVVALFLASQLATPSQPTSIDVLRLAKRAVEDTHSAAYVVTRDYTDSSGSKHKGHTRVLIAQLPFGFRADHQLDTQPGSATAVSDGKTTDTNRDGKTEQHATFAAEGTAAMNVESDAEFDVAVTWHLLLDPEYFRKAIDSGRTLYLWQDEIEDDPCHLILYARDHWTDYIWISVRTGLPRAIQRDNMVGGPAILSPRYEISGIRLNPQIPADAFRPREHPTTTMPPGASSSQASGKIHEPVATAAPLDIIGRSLPDLELRDPQYEVALLSALKGRPTLITFWAPWCAPCLEELAALEKLQPSHDAQLQLVAIAVQDRRTKALDFIRAHPQYKFFFFTDPDMERETSPLASFFGVVGIPVTVLTDPQGIVVDRWSGFDGEENLRSRLTKLIQR